MRDGDLTANEKEALVQDIIYSRNSRNEISVFSIYLRTVKYHKIGVLLRIFE